MANRSDLILEVDTALDSNGNYVSDWFDSGDVFTIRVVWERPASSNSQPYIQQSSDESNVICSSAVSTKDGTLIPVTARYYRLVFNGPANATPFLATIRAVD